MNKNKYVFAQLIEFLDNNKFRHLVDKYDGNRYVKHFTCWNQLLAMMFGQLSSIQKCSKLSENVFVLKHSSQLFLAAKLQNQVRFIAKCCIKDYNSTISKIELPCFIGH